MSELYPKAGISVAETWEISSAANHLAVAVRILSERREVSDVHRRLLKVADRIITEVFSDLNAEECARALRRATPVSDTGGPSE